MRMRSTRRSSRDEGRGRTISVTEGDPYAGAGEVPGSELERAHSFKKCTAVQKVATDSTYVFKAGFTCERPHS